MANPDQKTILLEQAYDELKEVCTKFQDESGATDMEVKTLLREKLDAELDISRKWASQAYSILKKRQAERKVAGV